MDVKLIYSEGAVFFMHSFAGVAFIRCSTPLFIHLPSAFRMIEEGSQFRKWQWISVRIEKANKDHRPESHKLYVDTIACGDVMGTKKEWAARRGWLGKIPSFDDFETIAATCQEDGLSLALLRPKWVIALEILKARNADWTDVEKEKLMRQQMQGELFSEVEARRQVKDLRKIPFDFYYRYVCDTAAGEQERVHKIVDWEVGALYWNCQRSHGPGWEKPFRAKLEGELAGKDLMFLMGNQHRFQGQWLIISLVYPPKQMLLEARQGLLF